MEVILKSHKARTKKKIVRDHYWYDPYTKQMLHGRGGRMEFVYRPEIGRSVPRIFDQEEWVYENNFDHIKDWVQQNESNYGGLDVVDATPGYNITIDINAKQFTSLIADLYHTGITFDYDDRQLRKEISTPGFKTKDTWQSTRTWKKHRPGYNSPWREE